MRQAHHDACSVLLQASGRIDRKPHAQKLLASPEDRKPGPSKESPFRSLLVHGPRVDNPMFLNISTAINDFRGTVRHLSVSHLYYPPSIDSANSSDIALTV